MGILDFFSSRYIKKYKAVLAKDPNDATAHFHLASEYELKGRTRDAIREFEETLRINPKSAESHFNLGVLYAGVGEGREAIVHIIKAGNLFGEKNDPYNKARARTMLREYYRKYGFKREDFAGG